MNFPRLFNDRAKSLRQIAVVVDGLDRSTADQLLERLPQDKERAIRDCIIELEHVDPVEREDAAREFYGRLMSELAISPLPVDVHADAIEDMHSESTGFVDRITGGVDAGVGAVAGLAAGAAAAMYSGNVSPESSERLVYDDVNDVEINVDDVSFSLDVERMASSEGEACELNIAEVSETQSEGRSERHDGLPEHVPRDLLPLRDVVEALSLESLATVLKNEQPQTVALVMGAMLPEEAAKFIAGWPQAEQGEILRRIAKLDRADPIVVEAVREELLHQLDQFADETARGEEGRERVQAIVAAAQGSAKDDLLGGLADADRELFRQVAMAAGRPGRTDGVSSGPQHDEFDPHLAAGAFDRFVDLSDAGLETVFEELDPDVATLALAGASQPCLSDVLERLPPNMSDDLRVRMESIGPLRLSDIQQAQLMAVAASHHLLSAAGSGSIRTSHLKLSA